MWLVRTSSGSPVAEFLGYALDFDPVCDGRRWLWIHSPEEGRPGASYRENEINRTPPGKPEQLDEACSGQESNCRPERFEVTYPERLGTKPYDAAGF
jgi:hypothetical protein